VAAALAAVLGAERAWPPGLLLASLGTDGEDGPTTAAGGVADAEVAAGIAESDLDVAGAVARCDARPLLEATGGLLVTGPTGTNVADIRIVLARLLAPAGRGV
jgi:glycerate 2-kinase